MISIRRDPVVTCTSILTAAVTSKIILAAAAPFVERARMRNGSNLDVWSAILSYYPCGRPMKCCDPNLTYLGNSYIRPALLFVESLKRDAGLSSRKDGHVIFSSPPFVSHMDGKSEITPETHLHVLIRPSL